ncbi:unnamed protein product [Bursaphelenchus okinawaensis]|uniref:G_PROTEIN_RECEP_F1_2 domain-containing protein n=1 Tax=Bursaphelenchus okinawaensis TaxID=465554 RepID=A0A811JPW4_9BILA|nr:unnamed protein product [Bursaphelenchus okinawaensis]CAG9077211.1 unnamed protein product [Bursaphelenchus okinawaensis]
MEIFAICLTCFCGIGKAVAVYVAILYRYYQALSDHYHETLKRLVKQNIPLWTAVFCVICFSILYPLSTGRASEDQIAQIASENPVILKVQKEEPAFMCLDGGWGGQMTAAYINLTIFIVTFVVTVVMVLYHLKKIMSDQKLYMSKYTYRVQLMLFKSIQIQLICLAVIVTSPLSVGMLVIIFDLARPPVVVMLGTAVMSIHSTLDCAILMYYVRPYREFLKSITKFGSTTDVKSVVWIGSRSSRISD